MIANFFDIHHHILCGLDDGARDQQMMFEMLRMAAEDGITDLIATPHAEPGIRPFSQRLRLGMLAAARSYCSNEGLDLKIHEGAEVLFTEHACRLLQDGYIPTLVGTNRVLVEFSPDISFVHLQRALEQLLGCGFLPVVAHAERYACLVQRPIRAASLKKDFSVFYQINCSTFLRGSFLQKRFAVKLLEQGLLDAVATDAHNTSGRTVCMRQTHELLCSRWGEKRASALTDGRLLGLRI